MLRYFRLGLFIILIGGVSFSLYGQESHADFESAHILCTKSTITQASLPDFGARKEKLDVECKGPNFEETNSTWLKWQIDASGTLSFTIIPLDEKADIDFVLYQLDNLDSPVPVRAIRCMAAGPNLGDNSISTGCTGATGIREGRFIAPSGQRGCSEGTENFLSALQVDNGQSYALYINNYKATTGFVLEWGGTASFAILPEKCEPDQKIEVLLRNSEQAGMAALYPNPATDQVSVKVRSTSAGAMLLQVISADGRLEQEIPIELQKGENILDVPVSALDNGVHFFKLKTPDNTYLLRFVKN